jgi:predicted metal-binding membrane protein
MLVLFAVGTGSLGWMLGLALVMGLEKNVAWGRRLSLPLAVVLLAWGLVSAFAGTPSISA